jgi:hypothetical protein
MRSLGTLLVLVLGLGVAVTHDTDVARAATVEPRSASDGRCGYDSRMGAKATAEELMADRYHLGPHRAVTLPHELSWREDPLHDRQWRYRLHMLRFVNALVDHSLTTGRDRYLRRGLGILRSWIAHNPIGSPATPAAWANMVTAWRAMTMVCVARKVSPQRWLTRAIAQHGRVLASPTFYVYRANHALNQAIALLDVACYLGRADWRRTAAQRIGRLVTQSVDGQGVSDEQSIKYEAYVYNRFQVARQQLARCGMALPPGFERVDRMPNLLAHATRPDGHYEMLGDTDDRPADPISGTPAEFAATGGKLGPKPSTEVAVFRRGYAFGRTGWGEDRAFSDEAFFSLRFGPGYAEHAHDDGGAVTLYGYGAQLLVDPGFGDANRSAWERYFGGRAAHNAVIVRGRASTPARRSILVRRVITDQSVELLVRIRVYRGVTMHRRVVFSRNLGYVVVEDTMQGASAQTYRQLWHLHEDARPVTKGLATTTHGGRGHLLIEQLVRGGSTRTIRGATDPLQGWISRAYGQHTPASVIERSATGRQVRFVTVLIPFTGEAVPGVRDVAVSGRGFSFVIETSGGRERVRATSKGVAILDAE